MAGSNNSLLAPIYLGDGHDSREHLRPDYMSAPIEQRTVEQDTASMSRYGSTYRQPSDAPSSYAELSHTAPIRDDGDRDCPFTDYYRGPSADAQGAERDRARNSHAGSYTAGTVQSPGTVQAAGTRAAASSGSERRDSARQAATPSIPSIKAPVPAAPGGEGLNKSALSYSAPVMVNDGRPRRTAANGSSIPASDATNSRRAATGGGQRGSLTLEQLLVAAVAILCGITLFPHLQRSVADYSYRFQEIPQTRQFP